MGEEGLAEKPLRVSVFQPIVDQSLEGYSIADFSQIPMHRHVRLSS